MAKRFDCEDEPNEFMEAPCRCDCGMWFDLEDGYSGKSNKIICRKCKEDMAALHLGDDVIFIEDCFINGRKRANKGDKGSVAIRPGETNGKTSVRVEYKHYPIHNVSVSILEKI